MKTFAYRGFAADGGTRRGLVEAQSLKDARERLAGAGVLAERLEAAGRAQRMGPEARTLVYRELSALLAAGVPLVRALELLIQAARAELPVALLAGVRDRVREGAALAEALAAGGGNLSEFERAVMQAGERSGTMAAVLGKLAEFMEGQAQLRDRVRRALIYPTLVVVVGLVVAGVMLVVLVPRAGQLLGSSGRELPGLTRAVLALAQATTDWGWAAILGAGVGGAAIARRWRQDAARRRAWDALTFRWPVWGAGYALLCSLRFARTLAMLLRGGVPLVEGVALAGRATGSAWVMHLADAQAQAVRHGGRLSEAVAQVPPLADALSGWIRVGEESGDLAGMLEHAGARCAERWERYLGRALALLEPVLLLVIGAFVLLITLAVLLPVLSLSDAVGRPG